MPQIFQALRCYKCLAFQVHQVKKSNKWECKLCGEKQSMKRHYGIGSGSECRLHVQKLNKMRGDTKESICYECSDDDFENSENIITRKHSEGITKQESKWKNYTVKTDETITPTLNEKTETLFGKEVVLELPKKHKKPNNKNRNYKKRKNNIGYENEHSDGVFSDNDVTNESIEIPTPTDTITSYKKQIKKIVPPTIKMQSKWPDYDSENINNTTHDISHSHMVTEDNDYTTIVSSDTIINNNLKLVTPTFNSHIGRDDERKKDIHFCNASIRETLKQNSKWNEFIEQAELSNESPVCHFSQDSDYTPKTNQHNLFSLCDDNDLDSILNI